MTTPATDKALRFHVLHRRKGVFLIPNPWDAGSARILAGLGFEAFATSGAAAAGVLGRPTAGFRETERCRYTPGDEGGQMTLLPTTQLFSPAGRIGATSKPT